MIHRAVFGSLERFFGVLVEHYAGRFPAWLAPTQAVVMPITDGQAEYAQRVADRLREAGFWADADLRNEKVGYKIRQHTLDKVPYMLVTGEQEVEAGLVAVRRRNGEDLGTMSVDDFLDRLDTEVREKKAEPEG
jgi:threonyl-tRNA synthetase